MSIGAKLRRATLAIVLTLSVPVSAAAAPRPLDWPAGTVRISVDAERVYGSTRFDTAVAIAESGFPGWTGISHVIVASGRSLADPLAAGGLCWAYDAPLLLVENGGIPDATRVALQEIVSANTTVTVTIVGGSRAVSEECATALGGIVGAGNVEQPFAGGDRYETAALISARVSEVASESATLMQPDIALIASGERYFDALSLAAVSARTGAPVLFTTRDDVPAATRAELDRLTPAEIIVAGGELVVSDGTYSSLGGTSRWAGATRYATAAVVAENAVARGWFDPGAFGVAASVPDALVGATLCARRGMPLLFTQENQVSRELAEYVEAREATVTSCVVFGGTSVVSAETFDQLEGAPAVPEILGSVTGGLAAKYATVRAVIGVNTSVCRLYSGSALVATRQVPSYGIVDFSKVAMPATGESVRVEVGNPEGGAQKASVTVRRLTYPASTSIVIDKSDFRLYWVRGDELIEAFPIAIGRVGMETPVATWKINAKYYTDPSSVYGPRKMRLFRQYGSSYVYTAYAVHGTNEPWVIGTKASHGCIRMYNADVLRLFPQVPLGTIVQTRE